MVTHGKGTEVKLIDLIAGARPNFMKIAPIIDALNAAEGRGSALRYEKVLLEQPSDLCLVVGDVTPSEKHCERGRSAVSDGLTPGVLMAGAV